MCEPSNPLLAFLVFPSINNPPLIICNEATFISNPASLKYNPVSFNNGFIFVVDIGRNGFMLCITINGLGHVQLISGKIKKHLHQVFFYKS